MVKSISLLAPFKCFLGLMEMSSLFISLIAPSKIDGLIDTRSNLNDYITQLEKEYKLVIEREPKKTKTGKKTTFMSEGKGKSVYIRSYKNENN